MNDLTGEYSGIITDCLKTYILNAPKMDAEIIGSIPALTDVMVDIDLSTDHFYKICTVAGIQGFCEKKYVAIRT